MDSKDKIGEEMDGIKKMDWGGAGRIMVLRAGGGEGRIFFSPLFISFPLSLFSSLRIGT